MGLFGSSKKKAKGSETPEVFGNKHLAGKAQSIGQDSANEVFKVDYKDQYAMGDESTGYFKPDADMAPAKNAVAASRLAQGMGWGDLIAETHYAKHDVTDMRGTKRKGVEGAVSKAAKGEAMQRNVFDTHNPTYTGTGNDITKIKGGKAYDLSGTEMNGAFDLSKSNTQKQLNQLQWFDALSGNRDRHGANIIIDPDTGKVTGIDNDLSFGDGQKPTRNAGKGVEEELESFSKGYDEKYLGLPEQIDEETADKLMSLTPDSLAAMLNPEGGVGEGLDETELKQVYDRLAIIQRKVKGFQDSGNLVGEWDQSTYQAALDAEINHGSFGRQIPRSYLQRHERMLDEAKDTDEPQFWRKGHRTEDTTPKPKWTAPDTSAKPATPKLAMGANRIAPPAPSSSWTQARPGSTKGSGPTLGANRSPAPTKPSYPPPPTPAPPSSKPATRTRAGSTTPIPSLDDTLANTPWARQVKRPKQPV